MNQPPTPELDLKTAQYHRLLAVDAGVDWHTDLGAGVYLWPQADESPALQCWPDEVSTEAREDGTSATTTITWTAVAPVGDDNADAELVRADLRAALVSACPMGTTREVSSSVAMREAGSNYATVTITVQTPIIIEGRFDG
jgi:hypothetical protein